MRQSFVLAGVFALLLAIAPRPSDAQETASGFQSWLDDFAQEALGEGISPATLRRVLPTIAFDESVIELDRKQPETKITFEKYLRNTLPAVRIQKGRRLLEEHDALLQRIALRYGVPPGIIVALWAVESSFGSHMGGHDTLSSLATLAYEGRRSALFRRELLEALRIVEEEGADPSLLQGSWAGAMGQCQFMPSTYRRYAVDWDGDGRRDVWANEADVLASIARYLSAEGWRAGLAWGREVRLTRPLLETQSGLEVQNSLSAWSRLGVRSLGGGPLPNKPLKASLLQPDGPGGRTFLVYDNFRALMRWNRSTYFATSVGLLADELEGGR